jgi:hypothetical protein
LHEAGLLAAAVAEALAAGPPADPGSTGPGAAGARRPVGVTVRVHDPMHVTPESAELHAEVALRERGLFGVPITVIADPVTCAVCEVANEVRADHPFCFECGFPLPDRGGHAVEVALDWGPAGAGSA